MYTESEIELDYGSIIMFLVKKWWVILSVSLVCAVVGFCVSAFVLPDEYLASSRIYILNGPSTSAMSYSDYQISSQIAADYKVLITGRNVTTEVIEQLDLDLTCEELEKKITVEALENTRVIEIAIRDTDPQQAMDIANCVRTVASTQIAQIMDVESVNLVYAADLPEEPVGPDVLLITILSFVWGLFMVCFILSIVHYIDDTIRTEEDVEKYLGISIMGVIPKSSDFSQSNTFSANNNLMKNTIHQNETSE